MSITSDVVRAYQTAEPYAGFLCFSFDLNRTLRLHGEGGLDTEEKVKALRELDGNFISSQSDTGDFTLYRGACGNTVIPYLKGQLFKSPAFSSATLDILTAIRFAHACDEISEGAPYLIKIIYPKRLPHINCTKGDESEIILPRDCEFVASEWIPTEQEQLKMSIGLSVYSVPENRIQLSIKPTTPPAASVA